MPNPYRYLLSLFFFLLNTGFIPKTKKSKMGCVITFQKQEAGFYRLNFLRF